MCTPSKSIPLDCRGGAAARLVPNAAGWLARALDVLRRTRMRRRMIAQAVEMDDFQLRDIGAPCWLVNEAWGRRELQRVRDAHLLLW